MSQRGKLFQAIRNNPRDVRLEDACKAAQALGFVHTGGKGAHLAYSRTGEPVALNFQNDGNGKIPPYQARQLIGMIEKYADE
jgi:hypothetical protein